MQTIKITIKNNYGNNLIYPINFVKELETLTGQKTLTKPKIEALKVLGFNFEIITPTIEV